MLSPVEQCRERALSDCDARYTRFMVSCACYALTGSWKSYTSTDREVLGGDTEWPWMVDQWPTSLEVESSKRLTDSNTMRRSRHLGGKVEPKVLGVDKYTAEARRGFWSARCAGHGLDSGWDQEIGSMFDDFDLLGVGSCGIGLVSDPIYRKQKVHVQHFKSTDVLWERNVRHPANSRRVVRRRFLTLEEALFRFQGKASFAQISAVATEMRDNPEGRAARIVPVIEYWDVGLASRTGDKETGFRGVMCEPTRCIWLGNVRNGPCVVHERNPFGCLPHAPMVNKLPPECRYPIGSVLLEMAANELATQMTRYLLAMLKKGPVDIWNKSFFDPKLLANHQKGIGDGNLDVTDQSITDMKILLLREPGVSVTNALPMLADMVDRRYNQAAGLSEADQGTFIEQDKTLGEFQQTQGEAASNRAFGKQQVEIGLVRLIDKAFKVAERYDRCPVVVDVFGDDYTVNDPDDLRNGCDMLFQEPGRNVVDQGALTASDAATQSINRLRGLQPLVPFAETGKISAQKLAEETLKALGEEPDDWAPTQEEVLRQTAQQVAQTAPAA